MLESLALGHKFSRNKFSELTCQKTVNFAKLSFAIVPCIKNFWEFIFASCRLKRSQNNKIKQKITTNMSFLLTKRHISIEVERGSGIKAFYDLTIIFSQFN